MYAYSNPTVYIDLYGYAVIEGADLAPLFYDEKNSPLPPGQQDQMKLNNPLVKIYCDATGKSPEEISDKLIESLKSDGYTNKNLSSVVWLVVEKHQSGDSAALKDEALEYLGEGFKEFLNNKDNRLLREYFNSHFEGDLETGSGIDIALYRDIADRLLAKSLEDSRIAKAYKRSSMANPATFAVYYLGGKQAVDNSLTLFDENARPGKKWEAGTSLAVEAILAAGPLAIAKVRYAAKLRYLKKMGFVSKNVDNVAEGAFSITQQGWKGYPTNPNVPKPEGLFRLLQGAEKDAARKAANNANRAAHRADSTLKGMQIHEIQPVKFAGSPTNQANKVPLTPQEHSPFTTWWRQLQRNLEGK